MKKRNIITLCGSTKFKEQFQYWNKFFTLDGNVIISVGCFGHSGDSQVFLFGVKQMLDKIHLQKIDMADQIFVIDKNEYIGQSTRGQIEYATQRGKTITYMSDYINNHYCQQMKLRSNLNE